MNYLRALCLAAQFLTRLPIPARWVGEITPTQQGRAVVMYPLVGLMLGILLILLQHVLMQIFPAHVEYLLGILLLLAWVLLTGGLHLDGLADSADAWLGGHGDREKTLRIMKDPYSGPAGAAAIMLLLLLKWSALLVALHDTRWLLLAPLLGRAGVVMLFLLTPYVRANGLGAVAAAELPRTPAWVMVGLSVVLTVVLLGYPSLYVLLAVVMMGFLLRRMMIRRIGGTTGDTAGALIEIVEVMVLLVAAARSVG